MNDVINVDGITDRDGRIEYIGKAYRVNDDIYHCIAIVDGSLCKVEVTIKPKDTK